MVVKYERLESRAALWCQRLAIFAVPFTALSVFLHRNGSITTEQTFWLLGFSVAIIASALLFGARAFIDLWERGYKGGKATVRGVVLSILLLAPFGVVFLNALEHPRLNDVATDVVDTPGYLAPGPAVEANGQFEGEGQYNPFVARSIVSNYPQLVARRYDAAPERIARSIAELAERRGWRILASQNFVVPQEEAPNPIETEGTEAEETESEADTGDLAAANAGGNGEQAGDLAGDEAEIEALDQRASDELNRPDAIIELAARSFVLRLPHRIVIRLREEGATTLVDMRASSSWGPHDLGTNADKIDRFLTDLDDNLAGLAGETR